MKIIVLVVLHCVIDNQYYCNTSTTLLYNRKISLEEIFTNLRLSTLSLEENFTNWEISVIKYEVEEIFTWRKFSLMDEH